MKSKTESYTYHAEKNKSLYSEVKHFLCVLIYIPQKRADCRCCCSAYNNYKM